MSSPSRAKGNRLEYLIVKRAEEAGIPSRRAYASNGRSLGCTDDVDVLMGGLKVQAKARKAIADYLKPPAGADITVVHHIRRGHTEEPLVVIPLHLFLRLASPALRVMANERREHDPEGDAE